MPGIRLTEGEGAANTADVIVIHVPDATSRELQLPNKMIGQIWVSWSLESKANYPEINSNLYDLKMTYEIDSDIPIPYYGQYGASFIEALKKEPVVSDKPKAIAAFISSGMNQSLRFEYLAELESYIDIDNYGTYNRNKFLEKDFGRKTKLEVFSSYKFCICI